MYKNLVLLWVGTCTALASFLSLAFLVEGATLPAGFSESIVFSGLTQPTAVRFSSDGRVFVAEKSGLIKVFTSLSDTTPTVFHDLRTNVHNFWDRGLLGLALHPNFPTVPSVYVSYAYDKDPTNPQVPRWGTPGATSDGCPSPPGATTDGCVVSGRLSRLELSSGSNVSTGTESVLIEGWGQQYPSHSVGAVMFGPDGALYASAGDGASFTFADYGQDGSPRNPLGDPPVGIGGVQTAPTAEGGATRAQSLRRVSGPAVLNGALIRVDPFTGAGVSGNPLIASADPNARRIVGYGFRNPFRFTFRPGTSELWIGDVGWNAWEEIDRLADPLTSPVRNFGWPCYEGNARQGSWDALNLSICETLYSQSGGHTPPYFTYSHSQQVVAGETCPTGSSSITGLAFNQGGTYPASYQGALFFADISRKCIWSMLTGANGLPEPATRATFAAGAASPVDLQIGPGGDLFYVDFDGGTIRRIQYTSGNQAPTAVIQATPLSGSPPLNVTFDGRASSDPNTGDTLSYSWDLDGDGTFGDALTAQTSFTYTQAKVYTVRLRVTDNHGAANSASVSINVGNSAPTAFIDAPSATTQWQVGQSLTFSGHATDPNGTLPPSAFSWEMILHHCPSNCHTHPVQSFSGVTTASFPAPDHDYPSHLEIKLTVTDAGGLTDTKSVLLYPQTVDLNFASTPSALELVIGSSNSLTPFTRTVIRESKNSVSAVTPQALEGITYFFASWSDGGNQSHTITGAASSTYTATYSLTAADIMPPTAPSSLTASAPSGAQITLSWPAATDNVGVTGYQVERCQGVGCTAFAPLTTTTATSYGDTGLTLGTSYSYRVRALDAKGNVSPYSPITTATSGVTGAIVFDAVSNSPVNMTAPTVSWTASVGSAANRLGLVCVQARGTVQANVVVSSVSIGGLAATKIRSDERNTGTEYLRTEQWYVVNPGTGSRTITINWAGRPSSYGVGTFLGVSGVDPVAPIDAQGGGTGLGATASASVTTVANNAWIADCAMTKQNLGFTIGAGQTSRTNRLIAGSLDAMAVSTVNGKTPAGTEIMDWTTSIADNFAISAVSLKPAVTETIPPTGAIAFDAVSNSPVNTTAPTVSWTASVGSAANRLGLVCVQARGTVQANVVVSSVSIGGLAATKIRSDERNTGTEYLRTEQWYVVNPGTGSRTITINWAGRPSSYGVGTFLGVSGVDPVAPIDAQGGGTGLGATASASVTTVANNAWIADCAMTKQNLGFTIGAGQTSRTNRLIAGSLDAMAVSTVNGKTSAGAEIMDWTTLIADNFAISAVSLKPAP